jgi:hypothetical protein
VVEFEIALPTAADAWKVAKRAEELGFSHVHLEGAAFVDGEGHSDQSKQYTELRRVHTEFHGEGF